MAKKSKTNGASPARAAARAGDYVRKEAIATTKTAVNTAAENASGALSQITDLNVQLARFAAHRYAENCRTLAALTLCRTPHDAMAVISDAAHVAADDYTSYTHAVQGSVKDAVNGAG